MQNCDTKRIEAITVEAQADARTACRTITRRPSHHWEMGNRASQYPATCRHCNQDIIARAWQNLTRQNVPCDNLLHAAIFKTLSLLGGTVVALVNVHVALPAMWRQSEYNGN